MNRWLYLLLLAAPAAVLAEALHAPPLTSVVRASLAGSIIGNVLLVLGSAMFVGGWRYRRQRFDPRAAGQYATMLALVVIGMAIPSLLATVGESTRPGAAVVGGNELHQLSIGIALILLVCYAAYIAYSVFGVRASHMDKLPISAPTAGNDVGAHQGAGHASALAVETPPVPRAATVRPLATLAAWWRTTLWLPIVVLAGVTAVTAVVSEVLVSTIEPVAHQIGLSPFFVGLIILPIVGNAAEHFTAITSAACNHMEISMAITAGSSIQIALLAAPLLVLAGPFVGVPLDLNFSLLEVALFGLAAGLYALISLDGESTWLEGLLLCAFYLILAVGTFFTPA